jgi:LmbE family N-acetylglucosaminyl deacetylase
MNKTKVLVVAVHPDDETIGCGGTILKHISNGDEVSCLFVTNGNTVQKETIPKLKKAYGLTNAFQCNLPEIILSDLSLKEIIDSISIIIKKYQPNVLYLPNRSDPHSDHRITFDAFQSIIKTFRFPFIKKVMMLEVISETDFAPALNENMFIPHVFVNISEYFEKKMEILKIFESELLDFPQTRSLNTMQAYNRYRGSQINSDYAEVFMLLKEIN